VQYVNPDGSKRFARESRKEGCFHVLGSTDPVGDLDKADAIVVAEGYATAATLKSLHAETGDPPGRVAFVGIYPHRREFAQLRSQLPRVSSSLIVEGVFSSILRYDTFTPRFCGNSKIFFSQALHRPAPEPIASLSLSVRYETVVGRWDRSSWIFCIIPAYSGP
jgi:hypothetical protein